MQSSRTYFGVNVSLLSIGGLQANSGLALHECFIRFHRVYEKQASKPLILCLAKTTAATILPTFVLLKWNFYFFGIVSIHLVHVDPARPLPLICVWFWNYLCLICVVCCKAPIFLPALICFRQKMVPEIFFCPNESTRTSERSSFIIHANSVSRTKSSNRGLRGRCITLSLHLPVDGCLLERRVSPNSHPS